MRAADAWQVLCLGVVLCVALPVQAQAPFPRAAAADEPAARCAAANRLALGELSLALESASNRHRLNPVMVSRLQTLRAELQAWRARVARETRNLVECEQLGQTLAAEHERLARMAGADPQVADCMAGNARAHRELALLLDGAARSASASQASIEPIQAALKRLDELRLLLARESQSLAACRQWAATLAQERTQAAALQAEAAAAADPKAAAEALANCRAANVDAYADARQAWRNGVEVEPRLRSLRDEVVRPAASLAECRALAAALEQERARAPSQASSAPP